MDLQNLSQAKQDAIYLQDIVKSIGGAAVYCWLPVLFVFWLSDIWTNEIISEEHENTGN